MYNLTSTALLTDKYEYTMLEAALNAGIAGNEATFEVFARRLPAGRRYGVVAGIARLADAIASFKFDQETLDYLKESRVVSKKTLAYLEGFVFSGSISAYPEGEVYFPDSPVLKITAPLSEAILLETLVLSVLNWDSAIAACASRIFVAAAGRGLIEMGGRRTHEHSAIAAARAAYLAGFDSTSNLAAGKLYGIPTAGTVAHAFILAHPDETSAFVSQNQTQGAATTALVDTYDIPQGIERAIEVFGTSLASIRIDSGDLAIQARRARKLLDSLGAARTKIVVSGDLDEFAIHDLRDTPIDAYGVGTRLVTGSGAATANFVYKLVEVTENGKSRPVSKLSRDKETQGGAKVPYRKINEDGLAVAEVFLSSARSKGPEDDPCYRPLQIDLYRDGSLVYKETLEDGRNRHRSALEQLGPEGRSLEDGPPLLLAVPWSNY